MPNYRKNYIKKPSIEINADVVWAAACQANTINGCYVKPGEMVDPSVENNRKIVDRLIADPTNIEEKFYENGRKVRDYYKGLTFKIIQGKTLSDFDSTVLSVAGRDTIASTYDLAVITSLPASYEKAKQREEADSRVRFATGGFVGGIGDKLSLSIEVLKSIYSQNYGVYFITGITDSDQPVFFSYKSSIELGNKIKVQGTVKAHREDSTQLSRVKVL